MKKQKKSLRWKSFGFLLINTLCWGAALVFSKPALEHTSAFRLLLYRYALAIPLSLPILIYQWKRVKQPLGSIKPIIGLELIGTTLALSCLYGGLALTTAIEASLITTTTPIFIVIAGILFLKEKQEKKEWFGLSLAFLGTLLLTLLPTLTQKTSINITSLAGNILIICQNIATTAYFILAKKYYKNLPKLFVTSLSFYVGFVTFLVLSIFESQSLHILYQTVLSDLHHPSVIFASFYLAIFTSIIGLTAYIKGQENIETSEASVFWYLHPFVYLPLGILLLGEKIEISQMIALSIILVGVVVAERKR